MKNPVRPAQAALLTIVVLLGSAAASAQAPAKPKAPPKAAPASARPNTEEKGARMSEMTCGELLFMLGDESQIEDSTYLTLWAYGVKTGASGGDLKKYPLTTQGLKDFVGSLYDACKVKSEAKVMDILTGRAGGGK